MTSIENSGSLLRTDEKGRVMTPKGRRESLLDEFDRSGVSAAKFAAIAGIKYSTFAAWVQRRRRVREVGDKSQAPKTSPTAVRWLEALIDKTGAANPPAKLNLLLPNGVRVELSDPSQVPLAVGFVRAWEKAASAC